MTIDLVRRALPLNMLRNKRAAFPAHVHAYAVKMSSVSTESDTGDSSKSSEPSSSTSSVAASLLDRLRCLVKSDLGRKRKIHANPPPPVGKKCSTSPVVRKCDPQSIRPSQRVGKFPEKH